MIDFNINRGLSTVLFSEPGVINPRLIIEEGCWYLCIDTAELFLGVRTNDGLTLKRINESDKNNSDYAEVIEALSTEVATIKASLGNYAKKTEIPSLDGYATEQYVINAIANQVPVEDLAKKEEVIEVKEKLETEILPIVPTVQELAEKAATQEWVLDQKYLQNSDIPDVSKFITEVPAEYVTEAELSAKGYITEHQSLEGYATEDFVKNAIAEAELNDKDVDISGLATKDEIKNLASILYVDEKVAGIEHPSIPTKVSDLENDTGYLTTVPDEYITESELAEELAKIEHPTVSLDGYATEAWVNEQGFIKEHQDLSHLAEKEHTHNSYAEKEHEHEQYLTEHQSLEAYAKKEELFSKDYNELLNKPEIPSTDGLASEDFVNDKFDKLEIPEVPTNISAFINDAGYLTEHQDLSEYAKKAELPVVSHFATKEELTNAIEAIEHPTVDLTGYATKDEIKDLISEIPTEYITESELEAKGYLTEHQSLAGFATEKYVDDAIANVDIPETDLSNYSTKTEIAEAIATAVAEKANEVLFTTAKFVNNPIGGFTEGEDVKDFTIAELFAKLLGLSDEPVVDPDELETPTEPEGIVEEIIFNKLPMYVVNTNGELVAEDFEVTTFTPEEAAGEPVESGFYQIVDNGEVVESGYQDMQIVDDEMYYIIAFPKGVDYNTMVRMQLWDDNEKLWVDSSKKLPLTNDPDTVAALCDEASVDISHIDTNLYTVWALEDTCTGSKIRYIIEEAN